VSSPTGVSAGRAWLYALAVATIVLLADQATKLIVVATIDRGSPVEVIFGLELANVRNRGIAFGLLGGAGSALVVLTVVTTVVLLAFFAFHSHRPGMWLAVGLVIGGAAGNLVDRVRLGAAVDFVDPPAWPAFNLADVAITSGVALIAWLALSQLPDGSGPGNTGA
jgi:signal peptidase II